MATLDHSRFSFVKNLASFKIMMQSCETEQDFLIRDTIQLKLNCVIQTNLKSKDAILSDLMEEFNSIKSELQGTCW